MPLKTEVLKDLLSFEFHNMKKNIEIDKLVVNPENYRFDPVDNQGEAIDLMIEEKGEEILSLAQHIYENGLDKSKDSRVVEIKKGLFLILDGNRRATAIKCMTNPSIIKKDSLKNKFRELTKGKGSVPKKINVFVYKAEAEASEWIKLDHTGKNNGAGQDPWDPSGKERFDWKFGGQISPATQTINLFEEETKHKLDRKKIKISTINRILSNPESRSYLGIDIRNRDIILTSKKQEVIDRLDKLFNKIIIDDISVAEVYRTPDTIKFMENLYGEKPKLTKSRKVVSAKTKSKKSKAKSKKSLPKSNGRNVLIPPSCVLQIYERKINNIYHELRSLHLDEAPNAIGVLFRVFLEISIDCYSSKYGLIFKSGTKLAGKIAKVADELEKSGISKSQLKNIRSVTRKGNSILSIDYFHEYVHSFKSQPVPVDLIYKWENLQEFFEILWEEIGKKERKKKK